MVFTGRGPVMNGNVRAQRIQTVCLVILSTIVVSLALYWLKRVVVPLALAIFLAIILSPLINFMVTRLRIPNTLAIGIIVALVFFILAVSIILILGSLHQLASDVGYYVSKLEALFEPGKVEVFLQKHTWLVKVLKWMEIDDPSKFNPFSLLSVGKIVQGTITAVSGTANAVITLVSTGLLTLLFVVFILVGTKPSVGNEGSLSGEIEKSVKQYVITKTFVSALLSAFVFVILRLFQVPYAVSFAAITFILNFIPVIGSVIATILVIPVMAFNPPPVVFTWTTIVIVMTLLTAIQYVIGNVIEPKIMGSSLGLSPITLMVALVFWGMLWGFVGMILAVPITAVIKIILEHIDIAKPITDLLAGDPSALMGEKPQAEKQTA
jgi:AI-2 transport protein TqsA